MSRNKVLLITAAVIFLGAVIWCAYILLKPKSNIVNITQDGTLLYTLDLSKEKDRTFTVEYKGRKNTVEIKDGRIRMLEGECPDHICVDTGWLEDVPIVCLPNRLVIDHADKTDTDAQTR